MNTLHTDCRIGVDAIGDSVSFFMRIFCSHGISIHVTFDTMIKYNSS